MFSKAIGNRSPMGVPRRTGLKKIGEITSFP